MTLPISMVIGVLAVAPLRAQAGSSPRPVFAAASVKENPEQSLHSLGMQFQPGGGFVAWDVPLIQVIAAAYGLPYQSERLTGGPDWLRTARWDIKATVEKGTIPANSTVKERDQEVRLMLQTLLAERFPLRMSRRPRKIRVYALAVSKHGRNLPEAAAKEKDCSDLAEHLGVMLHCHSFWGGQGQGMHGDAVSMEDLASYVSNWTDRPVVDQTSLRGLYKIETAGWAPMQARAPRSTGHELSAEGLAFADRARPTVFQIFERLGLKLKSKKTPVEMFVIESVEKPSAN